MIQSKCIVSPPYNAVVSQQDPNPTSAVDVDAKRVRNQVTKTK